MGEERGGVTVLTREDILAIAELMDERLKPINDRLDKVDARLDKVDARLDKVDARLDKVEQMASETRILIETEVDRAIKILGEGHQGIIDTINSRVTQDQLEEVSVRVFALEEGFKKHSEQIEELQQKTG